MSKKVLIIDDDPTSVILLGAHLRSFQLDFESASTLAEAQDVLSKNNTSAIFLDLYLNSGGHDTGGIEFLKWTSSSATILYPIPIIVLSVKDDVETMAECFGLGAKSFLIKPVQAVLLRRTLFGLGVLT